MQFDFLSTQSGFSFKKIKDAHYNIFIDNTPNDSLILYDNPP